MFGAIGIVAFWFFGWNGNAVAAAWSISIAGVIVYIALAAYVVASLRRRNGVFE